jgi:hypothetical protein
MCTRRQELVSRNPLLEASRQPHDRQIFRALHRRFPKAPAWRCTAIQFVTGNSQEIVDLLADIASRRSLARVV